MNKVKNNPTYPIDIYIILFLKEKRLLTSLMGFVNSFQRTGPMNLNPGRTVPKSKRECRPLDH